ncbi:hypothetical protein B0T19DRAFT_58250 [Cercophora scortea]|uniref:Elongin-A n=1 Tax=Cercophora scortea TaxID=314031 RepID=A0AAE0MLY6_9PEZI|nr:hypothetical protein B0T19DRAFT_58250 [Cercophora scortea]
MSSRRRLEAAAPAQANPNMGPRSLTQMCQRVAADNIKLVTSLAGVPSVYIGHILKAVTSPEQLHQIELNSEEDIYDETAEHWKRFIKRKYPYLLAKYQWVPSNPKSWHKVFGKYKKTQDELDAAATSNLMADFAARNEERISRTTKIVSLKDTRRLPQPKEVRSFGGSRGGWDGKPRVKQSFLQKTAKQVKEEAMRLRLSTATGKLPVRAGQITRAPESMLMDKRIERQFDPAATLVRAPRPKSSASTSASAVAAADQERQSREARLLQIKKAGSKPAPPPPSANVLNFDDDDDDDQDTRPRPRRDRAQEDADLFGDSQEFLAATPPGYAHSDDDNNNNNTGGGLTIDDLDSMDTDNPPRPKSKLTKPLPRSTTSHQEAHARRRPGGGLLSAAPGSNRTILSARSPSPKFSSPAQKPTPRPSSSTMATAASKAPERSRSSSPTQILQPPPLPRAPPKRKPVDIFNRRPAKKPRA